MSQIRFDEKGKYYSPIVSKETVRCLIQTTTHRIRGNVHVRVEDRLKDELDREEKFLAVTDAQIFADGGRVFKQCEFIAINREQIVWLVPEEQEFAPIEQEASS